MLIIFVVGVDIHKEVRKFLCDGHFLGDLGNCMPLAITNALGIPLIVISTMSSHLLISLNPREACVVVPILIAFNHLGCGHYDAIEYVPIQTAPTPTTSVGSRGCTCGRGDKSSSTHCILKEAKYTTVVRCPCLKQKKPCTLQCSCRNCHNEHGQRLATTKSPMRKRKKHKWQVHIPTSMKYGIQMGEKNSPGNRSMFELFVMERSMPKTCLLNIIQKTF